MGDLKEGRMTALAGTQLVSKAGAHRRLIPQRSFTHNRLSSTQITLNVSSREKESKPSILKPSSEASRPRSASCISEKLNGSKGLCRFVANLLRPDRCDRECKDLIIYHY